MSEEKTSGSIAASSLGEELLRGWLVGGDAAAPLDQWIFWNNSPSRHVPLATLLQFFPEKFQQILSEDNRVRSQVDVILRSKLSWSAAVAWRPQDPLWEISLVAPARLKRLAFLAAALSMKEVLAKIINGSVVRKLRQEIGEDIMEFVLLSGSLSKYFFTELTADLALVEDPLVALQQRSLLFVENAFSAKESGVQQRIASKVPGCFSTGIGKPASPLATKIEEMLCKLWKETSLWL
ncbi:MAG: hypothetical protein NT164_02505 [Verrucomicrobiae bacterium]|nr:hypothetical protein [Verrucomicrobiae bacterium]